MPARILVVEDDVSLGENLCEILGLFGYMPLVVSTAEEALEQLSEAPVDLIVTDARLPAMSGIDLLARVRAEGHPTPAVLLSDWRADDPGDLARSDLECVARPLDIIGLLGSIARLLGGGCRGDTPPPFTGW